LLSYNLDPRPPPFLPSPVSNLSLFLSFPVCHWSSLLTEGGKSQIIRPQESLALHKSLNILCTKYFSLYAKQLQLVLSGLAQPGHLAVNQTKPNWLVCERGEGLGASKFILNKNYVPSEKKIRQKYFIYLFLVY
jgi:hypothetical protein